MTGEQLLRSAPGSCGAIRDEINRVYELSISGGTYGSLWRNLAVQVGQDAAVRIAEDVVQLRDARRVLERILKTRDAYVIDNALQGKIRAARARARSIRRTVPERKEPRLASTRRKSRVDHSGIALPPVEYYADGLVETPGYAPLLVRGDSGLRPLRGRSDWLERHLEAYMERKWSCLDFGLHRELALEGRQAQLADTRERIDLIARAGSLLVPIELKIKQAGGSDLTQLQSYRQDLINRGVAGEQVLGVLVAPCFSHKVLNATKSLPGIVLRWVDVPV